MSALVDAPCTADLWEVLDAALGGVRSIDRAPYAYATSFPLEELQVGLADGSALMLIFKDLAWDRLLPDARRSKPAFLHEPRRSIEMHRGILEPLAVGPRCVASVSDDSTNRHWLFTEKVPGVELWQIGERSTWEAVARWLAGFHRRFAGRAGAARQANPHLLSIDRATIVGWAERARAALARSDDPRAGQLRHVLASYDAVAGALADEEVTVVHGELYASNVLVGERDGAVEVWPVDWEMAATGPAVVDLAALATGWPEQDRLAILAAHHEAFGGRDWQDLVAAVDRARLHLALQWIGWAPDWRAPVAHARDWIGEAIAAVEALDQ